MSTGTPPYDPAAEQAVLGAILRAADQSDLAALEILADTPEPGDYWRPQHERLATVMHTAAGEGTPLQAAAILGRLQDQGDLKPEWLDGPYLMHLIEHAAANGQTAYYTRRIQDAARQRRAIATTTRALQRLEGAEPDDVAHILADTAAALQLENTTDTGTRSSWQPVDLDTILAGKYERPTPTIGARADGIGVLYPGRHHTAAGESEAGKSWFALTIAKRELEQGHAVVYLDFEDDPGAIVGRLLDMGTNPDHIAAHFAYIAADEPINTNGNTSVFAQAIGDLHPTLGIIDGVTEAMTMHGYDLNDNTDIALFNRAVPGRITAAGAASLSLDHVTKSKEGRGRYAIGGQHKLAGLNGAAFTLDMRTPFGVGITGRTTVFITKDRPAELRRHTTPYGPSGNLAWFADLTIEPLDKIAAPGLLNARLEPPNPHPTEFRPTVLMTRIAEVMTRLGKPLKQRELLSRVKGNAQQKHTALLALVDDGYVEDKPGPHGSTLYTLTKPYPPDPESPPEPRS